MTIEENRDRVTNMDEKNFKKVGQKFRAVTWKSHLYWLVCALETPVATQGVSRSDALAMIKDALEGGYGLSNVQIEDIGDSPEGQAEIQREIAFAEED